MVLAFDEHHGAWFAMTTGDAGPLRFQARTEAAEST